MSNKIGAPKGGFVHWLVLSLPADFKKAYLFDHKVVKHIEKNYNEHHYVFYRLQGRKLYDIFVIVQTSEHYWHVTYYNARQGKYDYFGDKKTSRLARRMWFLYEIDRIDRE